ncbi:unnamed protein product [Nezara viridula]|uniref:Uncharacterized protein n=1 Tax=Nezara viridula TaxID=85310 RepID=A0A9P0E9V4_NEZVI|nr:unnamed protein product [Nezara viridula]
MMKLLLKFQRYIRCYKYAYRIVEDSYARERFVIIYRCKNWSVGLMVLILEEEVKKRRLHKTRGPLKPSVPPHDRALSLSEPALGKKLSVWTSSGLCGVETSQVPAHLWPGLNKFLYSSRHE